MNPMSLPNVTISPKLLESVDLPRAAFAITHTQLSEIVWSVASQYPLWELRIVSASTGGSVKKLHVYQEDEHIGELGYEHSSRSGGYVVYIKNDRISASRSRNSGKMLSGDTKKLLTAIKKNFGRKTIGERLEEAENKTLRALGTVVWEHSSNVSRIMARISEEAMQYVTGAGRELYVQHLQSIGSLSSIAKLDEVKTAQELAVASTAIKDMYNNQQMALVILDNDKYIVKYTVSTELYDTNSFPQALRRSLGMLKLVEKGQVISNSGMRVDENVFIVVQDKPE